MRRLFTLSLLFSSLFSRAQTWTDTLSRIEKIMSRYQNGNPGAQLAISRNGQLLYSTAKGMANLEDSIPLANTSRIEAGSVSKQFTAACILLLEQQGKLSINDDIRKYLPELPTYGHTITIYHLMHHISGIKDWGSVAGITGWPRTSKNYTNDDALHIISRQTTLNNIPGDEYIYSNSNYNLQAIIIQRVSGMSLAEFSKRYIFTPAGMIHTEWRDDYRRIVPHRAIAYTRDKDHYFTNMPNEYVYGNGGLLTTAEDLLKWNEYYTQGHFGQPSLLSKQLFVAPLNNGRHHNYAAGLMIDTLNGQPFITHSGATAAYRANLEYFPATGLSIAWLANTSEQSSGRTPYEIRSLFAPNNKGTLITPKPPKSDIPLSQFNAYMGVYADTISGEDLHLYMRSEGIYTETSGGPLGITDAHTLKEGRTRLVFTSETPRALDLIEPNGRTVRYKGIDSARTDPAAQKEYAGKYYSEEAETVMYIDWKNDRLIMYPRIGSEEHIRPVYKDGFAFEDGYLTFRRNAQQKIAGFYISVSRARKVRFDRVP